MRLMILWLLACGDKSEDTATVEDTVQEQTEETGAPEDTSVQPEDTAESSDTAE